MPAQPSFYARYNVHILAAVFFFLPFAIVGAFQAKNSNKNQVKDWLPPGLPANQVYREFRQQFQGDEFILASWEGCTLDDQRLKMMAQKLEPPTEDVGNWPFKEVTTGPRAIDMVAGLRPQPGVKASEAQAADADEAAADKPTKPKGPWQLSDDPTIREKQEQAVEVLTGWLIGPTTTNKPIEERLTCLVVKLSEHGRENMRETVAVVHQAATECNIPGSDLHMGGPPVDNVAIDQAGEERLTLLFGVSILIGVLVSWYSLRSFRLVALVVLTGVYSMFISLALIYYTGRDVNAIVLTMPTLVYVATTSGAIHLANYYRDSIRDGVDAALAPGHAIAHAWLPLSLATGTTAVGLMTLCYSNLVPIQMFGVYSAIGVIVSLLLLFFFIPAVLQTWPTKVAEDAAGADESDAGQGPENSLWWRLGRFIATRHAPVLAGCLALMIITGWGMTYSSTSVQLMKLFSPGARILEDYAWLEEKLGPLVPMEIVLTMDKPEDLTRVDPETELNFLERLELVERVQREIESLDEVGATMSAKTFVQYDIPRRAAFGINPRDVANRRLVARADELKAGDYLRDVEGPSGEAQQLYRISARVRATENVDYALFIQQMENKVQPVLDEYQQDGIKDIRVAYTGVMPLVYHAQRSLLNDLIFGFFTDFALIVVVMMIACRDWSAGPVLLIPSAFPAIAVFGLLGWLRIPIDIGTVMAPAVALGVTVDDVVHFMLWFRRGIAQGMSRVDAVMLAYKGCARAMYQSWGVIGLGLSVYSLSPFAPTQRFGYLMVSLLTAALIGNLLLLPSILAGPVGAMFAWGIRRQTARAEARSEARRPGAVVPTATHGKLKSEAVPEPHVRATDGKRQPIEAGEMGGYPGTVR